MKTKQSIVVRVCAIVAFFATGLADADPFYGYGSYGASYRSLGFYEPNLNNPFYRGQAGANTGWYAAGNRGYYFSGNQGFAGPGPQLCVITQCDDSPLPVQCVDHPICSGQIPQPRAFWWQYYDWDGAHDPNPNG